MDIQKPNKAGRLNEWAEMVSQCRSSGIPVKRWCDEHGIKPFVIGRKNFLFANTARGAKASAVMYSLIETAKENRISPYDYLVWVFKCAPEMDISENPGLAAQLFPIQFIQKMPV